MQVVILAAGKSSRFYPYNKDGHKSMFSLCGKPILAWALDSLKNAGINEIIVVVSPKDNKIKDFLASFKGINLKVVEQSQALGMGNALLCAKALLKEKFFVVFAHLVNADQYLNLFDLEKTKVDGQILADITNEPWKYGIIKAEGNRAYGIKEKPRKGEKSSNIRSSGVYLLSRKFIEILAGIKESENTFEETLDHCMKETNIEIILSKKAVMPLKYPWDLMSIKDYLLENLPEYKAKDSEIAKTATIRGKVIIESGVKISDYSLIEGPAYIGKNALVGAYSILRENSVLEEGAQLERYVDCARSIVGKNSHIHSGFIGDSIVGQDCSIGAGFITANKRIDRGEIFVKMLDGKREPSGRKNLGAIIGHNVQISVNVATMPGKIIGNDCQVGPCLSVFENVPSGNKFYMDFTKFRKLEEK